MIGRVRIGKHARIVKLYRPTREDPVQRANDDVRSHFSVAERVPISGFPKAGDDGRRPSLGVEIAGYDDGRSRRVAFRVGQHFIELQKPALLATPALKMQIID